MDRLNTNIRKNCNIYNNPYLNSGTEDDPRTTMTRGDGQVTTIPGDEATRKARK